ncbi:hypothetical protein ACQP1G_24635 [Nocardia sp. CA-107356]|uniref:hypothetical protein n=1 Tax=Nocardia sp. CA-107356 TaxID=3239972 RepID=UPI003D8DBC8A
MAEAPALIDSLWDLPTNRGKHGSDDEAGALNYPTAEEVVREARESTAGKVFTWQRLIRDPNGDPVLLVRSPATPAQPAAEFISDVSPGAYYWRSDPLRTALPRRALRYRSPVRAPPASDGERVDPVRRLAATGPRIAGVVPSRQVNAIRMLLPLAIAAIAGGVSH